MLMQKKIQTIALIDTLDSASQVVDVQKTLLLQSLQHTSPWKAFDQRDSLTDSLSSTAILSTIKSLHSSILTIRCFVQRGTTFCRDSAKTDSHCTKKTHAWTKKWHRVFSNMAEQCGRTFRFLHCFMPSQFALNHFWALYPIAWADELPMSVRCKAPQMGCYKRGLQTHSCSFALYTPVRHLPRLLLHLLQHELQETDLRGETGCKLSLSSRTTC